MPQSQQFFAVVCSMTSLYYYCCGHHIKKQFTYNIRILLFGVGLAWSSGVVVSFSLSSFTILDSRD